MPDYTQTLVSALEYEALSNLDKVLRITMSVPNTGHFLVSAIQALDQVRKDQGLEIPQAVPQREEPQPQVSELAQGLIRRAMRNETR